MAATNAHSSIHQVLTEVLACRDRDELCRIRESSMAMYSENLANIDKEHNELHSAIYMWMLEPHERDAIIARSAIEHFDVQYRALIEIYASRKSSQLFRVRQAYQDRFHSSLDQDIIADTSNSCQRILVALAASQKAHQTDVNKHIADCDAKRLHEAGKAGAGGAIDEAQILEILSKRSVPQLRLAVSTYKRIYGHNYTKSLTKSTSGEFEESLRTIIKCMCDTPRYYSKMLHTGINGMDSDKSMLTRVIVTRVGVDMDAIKREFQTRYKTSLCESLRGSSSIDGDYRDFLVGLIQSSTSSSCEI